MIVIAVELLHGVIRATSAADTSVAGQGASEEWPPSPARVFAALIAGDGTRDRARVTTGTELLALENALPPVIHADSADDVLVSDLEPRFVVLNKQNKSSVQEYPGRLAGVVRPGSRVAPRNPLISYIWPDLELGDHEFDALAARAARVGYIGCADSPARMTVLRAAPSTHLPRWTPDSAGSLTMPVPYPGLVEVLDTAYDRWTERGEPVRKAWLRTEHARYRPPGTAPAGTATATTLWLRFDGALAARRLIAVTQTLKGAVLDLFPGVGGAPAVLHGHGFTGHGYEHARFLALPDAGHGRARGRIHGAAVWLPPDTEPEVVAGVRASVWKLRRLVKPGWFDVAVRPHGGERRPWACHPSRWTRTSRRWVSVFPVVHERHAKRGPSLADVRAWCAHAGAAEPIAFRVSRVPLVRGAAALRPREVFRRGKPHGPYSHLEVTFPEPVGGPITLGRGRHFGLGLMAPCRDDEAE